VYFKTKIVVPLRETLDYYTIMKQTQDQNNANDNTAKTTQKQLNGTSSNKLQNIPVRQLKQSEIKLSET
jgi:hypothetical protein